MAETTDLQKLVVSLEAKLDKFDRAMAKLAQTTDSTLNRVQKRFSQAEGVIAKFGAGLSAAAILDFVKNTVSGLAALADASRRAGVGVADLQRAIFAARQEGASADSIVQAFTKLNLKLGEAAMKGNDLSKIFAANNIELSKMLGDPVKALTTIADLMKNARNQQDAMVIAQAAFGKGAQEILPFLLQGGDAIKAQMDRATELGAVIDEKLVSKAKELDDKLTEIADVALVQVKVGIMNSITEFEKLYNIAKSFSDAVGGAFGRFGNPFMTGDETPAPVGRPNLGPSMGRPMGGTTTVVPIKTDKTEVKSQIKQITTAVKELHTELDFTREAARGFAGDLIHGLKDGQSATEALSNAFSRLADKMIDSLLDQAVTGLMGPSGSPLGGLLGNIFKGSGSSLPSTIARNPFDIMRGVPSVGGAPTRGPHIITNFPRGLQPGLSAPGMATGQLQPTPFGTYPAYTDLIHEAAQKYGLDPDILAAMIHRETGGTFRPDLTSPAGAQGLAQLMPGTQKLLGVTDPFDPRQSIMGGASYLRSMMDKFGSVKGGLYAYNMGPGGYSSFLAGNRGMPMETQQYAPAILQQAQKYAQSVTQVSQTAQQAASGFAPAFPSALQSILGAVGGMGGMGGGGGLLGSFFNHFGGIPMSTTGGITGGAVNRTQLRIVPSKYFDVHVERISSRGDARTLSAARKNYPNTADVYQKLGTTSR